MKMLLLFLLLTGSAAPLLAQGERWYRPGSRLITRSGLHRTISDTMGTPFYIHLPVAVGDSQGYRRAVGKVFAALSKAYGDLKIVTDVRDSAKLEVGNQLFDVRFDIGGRSSALYFECGQDVNGIYAEIYRLQTSLVSFLTPMAADSVEVRSVLLATAVGIPKAQPTKECSSTGALEKRIFDMMLKSLGKEGFRSSGLY